jgi:hypothetical protein
MEYVTGYAGVKPKERVTHGGDESPCTRKVLRVKNGI